MKAFTYGTVQRLSLVLSMAYVGSRVYRRPSVYSNFSNDGSGS
jgi:hypothetical protein